MAVIDRVRCATPNGIRVIVIGAGVGGLTTALECFRKGCEVRIFERDSALSPFGDFFTIPPAGLVPLQYYPTMRTEYENLVNDCTISAWSPNGKLLHSFVPEWKRPGAEHPTQWLKRISFLNLRKDWANMLLGQVRRLGIPIHFGTPVAYAGDTAGDAWIKTSSGHVFHADLVVSAGGIGSSIEGMQAAGSADHAVVDSGFAAARVSYSTTAITPGSPAESLLKNLPSEPEFRVYLAPEVTLIAFLTEFAVAWVVIHAIDPQSSQSAESWHNKTDASEIVTLVENAAPDWDPAVIDLLRQSPTKVVDWRLKWRDVSKRWTSENGRLTRLGDASHSMLPTSGNGAVQAIEDSITIAECLSLGGKQGVPQATKVFNELRFERTSTIQHAGFINREELGQADLDAYTDSAPDRGFFNQGKWTWSHNAELYARDNYTPCTAHLQKNPGEPYPNTNLPPGHTYEPWSLESERARVAAGKKPTLKQNGYWGC